MPGGISGLYPSLNKQKSIHFTDDLIKSVAKWGRDKGLTDPIMQFAKCQEECGEIAHELTRNHYNTPELNDALGDTFVTLIILADILGYDLVSCLEEAYGVIKDRRGRTMNGSFIKDEK